MQVNSFSGGVAAAANMPSGEESAPRPAADGESNATLMSDPMLDLMASGDIFEKIAALMTQSFRQDRKQAREAAQIEEKSIMAEGRKRVKAMRDEADAIRKEAYVKGGTQIASGTMALEGTLQLGRDPHATTVHVRSDQYASMLSASAKATEGLGTVVAGGYKGEQQDLRADAAEHEMLSEAAKRRAQEYRDQAADAREMLNKVADFLRDVKSAQNDASKAAIMRA